MLIRLSESPVLALHRHGVEIAISRHNDRIEPDCHRGDQQIYVRQLPPNPLGLRLQTRRLIPIFCHEGNPARHRNEIVTVFSIGRRPTTRTNPRAIS